MKLTALYRWISPLLLAFVTIAALNLQAHRVNAAGPIVVNTWRDEFDTAPNATCSLREAIVSANEGRAVGGCASGVIGPDEIILPANLKDGLGITRNFEVNLGAANEDKGRTGDLDILDALTIRGAGSALTTIASNSQDRVFHVLNTGSKPVTIDGVKITGGAGVDRGGGVYNENSTLYLKNAYIIGNRANLLGGGVRNKILLGSSFGSTLIIFNTIISTNYSYGDGGGIDNDGNLTISHSLVSTNSAVEKGGGISNNAYGSFSVVITNTTIRQNIGVNGAGIYTASENFTLSNSTIVDNIGTPEYQAIVGIVVHQNAHITFKNTIIAGHPSPRQNCTILAGAQVISNGHNLEDANTCGLNTDGVDDDLVNTPAGLDIFGDYGSSTLLYGLLPDSAAVDAGANEGCPGTDQRGVHFGRPSDGNGDMLAACDIGAFERDALPAKNIYLPQTFR